MPLRRHLRSPRLWLASAIFWAIALFILSSLSKTLPDGGPEIPQFDKVLHFTYFMGGGFLYTTYVLLRKGAAAPPKARIVFPIFLFTLIGALDEYHQTFTPGRSGNDPFDWLADILGATAGIILANRIHPFALKLSSPGPQFTKNSVQ